MTLGWLVVWVGLVFLAMVLGDEKVRRAEKEASEYAVWWAVLRMVRCVRDAARNTSIPTEEIVERHFENEFFGPSVLTPEEKRCIVAALNEIREQR